MSDADARALLDDARRSRGHLKRAAARLDEDPALRDAVVGTARAAGIDVPDDVASGSSKRLLRVCLDRSDAAQVIRSPIRRDEAFRCAVCALDVAPHGRTARNHCPRCLCSLHVDVVPGDRAAGCGGVLDPIGLEVRGGEQVLTFRCRSCGAIRHNRALLDGEADDVGSLARLSAGEAAWPR